MSRPIEQDKLQGFRYKVTVEPQGIVDFQSGFQSITIPELSVEVGEYREGHYRFTRKQPGVPTVSDATFNTGVVKSHTPFFDWMKATIGITSLPSAISGYRVDLSIHHYHIMDEYGGDALDSVGQASKKIVLNNCFPLRAKPAGDFDATASDISLAEMDVACESMDIEILG
jgi:phage tail-like protein